MDEAVHILVGFFFPALVLLLAGAWQFALLWMGTVLIWEAWKVIG